PGRSARTTGAALDSLRQLRGRQVGRDGTGRVGGDRGDGGGRPPDPGDRIEPRYLPVDRRVDRALDLWDARGEGGPRPPAVWRGREDHARRAADPRRYPSDPGRRSGNGQERALVLHDPALPPRNLRDGEGRFGGGPDRSRRPGRIRRGPMDPRSGSLGPCRSRARRHRRNRENDTTRPDGDRELAEHILKGHKVGEIRRRREAGFAVEESTLLEEPFTPHFDPDFFRKYVAYAKRIYPVMTDEAMEIIEKKYLEIRKTGEAAGSSVPITPRQLEAIIRLSEAGARLRLSEAVDAEDAERAVRIVEYWMGKVAGEEGRFDIDIIQTGISQSQREQIISIRDIINELAGPEGVADYEDIVRIAQERGIPPAKVDAWLKRWAQEGEIYSPAKNKYKLVERL